MNNTTTAEKANKQIETANMFWRQAGVRLDVQNHNPGGANDDEKKIVRINNTSYNTVDADERPLLMRERTDGFEVYFVEKFIYGSHPTYMCRGLNTIWGIMVNTKGIKNGKTTSHELGHAITGIGNEGHSRNRWQVMFSGREPEPSPRGDVRKAMAEAARTGNTHHN